MLISSVHGVFSVVISEQNSDKVEVRSNNKNSLARIFDAQRIKDREGNFFVCISKQEFANTLIMMIKEIDYSDLLPSD